MSYGVEGSKVGEIMALDSKKENTREGVKRRGREQDEVGRKIRIRDNTWALFGDRN